MSILYYLIFVLGMVALAAHYCRQLFPDDPDYNLRWLLGWVARGVLPPVIAWAALNTGSHPVIPAIIRMSPPAGAGRLGMFLFGVRYVSTQTGPAMFVVASYWAALTVGWLVAVTARRTQEPREFMASAAVFCLLLSPFVALLLWIYGLLIAGLAALLWFCPLAQHALSLRPVKRPPVYARAVASLKFGKYHQAEQAIISELERCETDFDGWLMLAELYAKQFHDLGEAERTVHGICEDPATTLAQMAVALNRLADWQLEFRHDPNAARLALDELIRRAPGTHLARMAGLRQSQLPATPEEWKERHHAHTIHLPPLGDKLDAPQSPAPSEANRIRARDIASQCLVKLQQNPADVPAREKLAAVYADQLGELAPAVRQIETLLQLPAQPPEKMAAWLALLASWEIRRGGDRQAAARAHLERLVREYPQTVQALAARRRLDLLDAELSPEQPPPTIGPIRLTTDGSA